MGRQIDFSDLGYLSFRDHVGTIESSNDYEKYKGPGYYLGRYQFGEMFLVDLGYYTYKGDNTKNANDWVGEWTGKNGVCSKEDIILYHRLKM